MICVGGRGMKVFADGFEKQKIFLLALSILIEPSSGTTAEAVSSLGEMTTVHSMFFQDRRSTPITSRWVDGGRLYNDLLVRWRMSVVLVMTRPGASFSPAMPLTRWTRFPASSATTKWSSLKGEEVSSSRSGQFNCCRYPLIDGTFFISPRQHSSACIQVKAEGRPSFLSAVCMACLEGWTSRLQCRNTNCAKVWDGSQLILGTMYSYDIFAAVPCCAERLKVRHLWS